MKHFIVLSIITLCFSSIIFAQNQDTEKATFKVTVADMDGTPKSGETIHFVNQMTKNKITGISKSNGIFEVQLSGGYVYDIMIQGIGTQEEYYTIEVPTLKENESYGINELTINFSTPRVFTLNNVHFDTGSAFIRPSSNSELKELFDYMSLKPELIIEIAGHTDNVGETDSNLKLSQDRADAVRNWLIRRGIAPERITAKGYGESQPVAYNDSPEGKQKNRRTEVRLISE